MSAKMLKVLSTITASVGVFSLAAFMGSFTAGALWNDEETSNYSYSVSGLKTTYSIDDAEPIEYKSVIQNRASDSQTLSKIWTEETAEQKITELLSNGEAYTLLEFNAETYGLSTFTYRSSLQIPASTFTGPIFSNASVHGSQVNSPNDCGPGFNTASNVLNVNNSNTISSASRTVYSNDSETIYLCLGYSMNELGESGTHSNTVTVEGDSELGGVSSSDSWSGQVESYVPGVDELGQYVDEETTKLAQSSESIRTSLYFSSLRHDPENHDLSPNFPDYSEGQPVYVPATEGV